jgi:hypothetical protein
MASRAKKWWIGVGLLVAAAIGVYLRSPFAPWVVAVTLIASVAIWTITEECWYSAMMSRQITPQEKRRRIILLARGSWRRGLVAERDGKAIALLHLHWFDQFLPEWRIKPLTPEAKEIDFWREHGKSLTYRNRLTGTSRSNIIPGWSFVKNDRYLILTLRGLWQESVDSTICERAIVRRYHKRVQRWVDEYRREHANEMADDVEAAS